jgi:TRAP-type C4-dicarboxylate transport system permease small subunit
MSKLLAAVPIPPEVGGVVFPGHNSFISDLPSFAQQLLGWFLGFAGAFAVIAVVWAGFMYITSGGNSEQAEKAKKNLTWAIIGVVLVAFSSAIVFFVNDVLNNVPH